MSGNGLDTGHIVAMLTDVLAAQESMRVAQETMRVAQETMRGDLVELRTEMREVRSELGAQGRKIDDLAGQVASLRQAVTEYHSTVLGHGILISELDVRLRRVEQHLNLPPAA